MFVPGELLGTTSEMLAATARQDRQFLTRPTTGGKFVLLENIFFR
jgi:hypothetical protein